MKYRYNFWPEPLGRSWKSKESNWFKKIVMDLIHDIHIEYNCRGMYDGSYWWPERYKPDYDFWYTVYYDKPKEKTMNILEKVISWFYDKVYKSRTVYIWIQPNNSDKNANKEIELKELKFCKSCGKEL